MKKIVFIIHTEYHLLFALKIVLAIHHGEKDNLYIIYRLSPKGSKRLNQELNFEGTGIEYRQIIYNNRNYQAKELRSKVDGIIMTKPDALYVFNESQKVYPYLFRRLKKIGCRIVLCPDGANVYANNTPLKERFIQFINGNVFLWTNRFSSFLPFPSKHYAYHKEIDDVVVENRESYHNLTNKNVICISKTDYSRESFIYLSNRVFHFNPSTVQIPEGSLLWIDQPVEGMEESKRRFLIGLKKRFEQRTVFIKPHPHSFPDEIKHLECIDGVKILRLDIPVELLLDNLNGVGILSAYSTAMYYYNPRCRYYWVSPLFKELPEEYSKLATFGHIKVVNSIEQIDF